MAKVRLYWRGTKAYIDWVEGGERFRRSIGQLSAREAEGVRSAKEAELTHGVRILARLPKVRDYLEWYLDWYAAEHPTTITKNTLKTERYAIEACLDTKKGHHYVARDLKGRPLNAGKAGQGSCG